MPPLPTTPAAAPSRDAGAFLGVLERIEATIDAESAAFRNNTPIDLTDINRRKHQGLLELSRISGALPPGGPDRDLRARLERLSEKLETNRRLLDVQLTAVRDVSDIIATAMRDAESDGTYSLSSAWA